MLWGLPLLPGKSSVLMAKMREENASPGPRKTCPNILHRLRATFVDNGSALQRLYVQVFVGDDSGVLYMVRR